MSVLLVALGAAVGAPTRFLTDRAVKRWLPGLFPWGTFVVNVVASLLLGLVTALAQPMIATLVGVGFCGALSTYSTFSYETFSLLESRRPLMAIANLVASIAAGVAAVVSGWAIGHIL